MIRKSIVVLAIFASLSLLSVNTAAQIKQRIKFVRGTSSTTVKGIVRGYAYRDYVVGASAGRMMRVGIRKSSGSYAVFSIFRPDGNNLGTATETESADGELPVSGDYVIRVGMMRSDARRRGAFSNYTLSITIE